MTKLKWDKKKLLKELREARERNRISNLQFVDLHVAWLKRTSNKEWSKQQKRLIDSIYKSKCGKGMSVASSIKHRGHPMEFGQQLLAIVVTASESHCLYFSIAAMPWNPNSSSFP